MKKSKIEDQIKEAPLKPGVYFFKDNDKEIIYIGKAARLRKRIQQYFQSSKQHDFKTQTMIGKIEDIDWITVDSEVEALFLESEMIKRYQPKFNIDLRDDKNWLYVKITLNEEIPTVNLVRRPMDDGAEYFGPFTSATGLRRAMKELRKAFPYHIKKPKGDRVKLDYHIGLSPGLQEEKTSLRQYRANLRKLMQCLQGNYQEIIDQLEAEMAAAAEDKNFEQAATLRDRIRSLESLSQQQIFGDQEMFDLTRDQALEGLSDKLGLAGLPRRIEAYDISHIQGIHNVASMVVFQDGVPNRSAYRKFKMRTPGNDDYIHLREVVSRRFRKKHLAEWPKPDLLVIDGGKGQLQAVLEVLEEKKIQIPTIALAKKEETIIKKTPEGDGEFQEINLPANSHALKLLQHLRDEAHRFAINYHSQLRRKQQTASILEEIPGIGPKTRQKLLKKMGSFAKVKKADRETLQEAIGSQKGGQVYDYLH